jgi:SET domain
MANYRVVRFPNRGRGIEATCDIPQGAIVVASPCVAISKSELHASLALYAFRYGDQAALAFGDASFLNHSRSANCDYHADQVNRTIVVKTSRSVRRGEELTIDYGWDLPDFVTITGRSTALEPGSESHRCWLLAESYREADRLKEAAQAYAMRAAMSADEEAWYARVQEARCLRMMGDEGGFVRQALAAFDQRPVRAEPLYDLARFCRERGMNTASILFSEAGLAVPTPDEDALFVEEFVYRAGLKEEFALAAYAPEPARRTRARKVCNWLALARAVPEASRIWRARTCVSTPSLPAR